MSIMGDYIFTEDAAQKWSVSKRRITVLCNERQISGVLKIGITWAIPQKAEKPLDALIKSGKYTKSSQEIGGIQ